MRTAVIMVLIAVLITEQQLTAQRPAADSSVKQEIAALSSTSLVEVRLTGGDRVRGHIVSRTDSEFSLEPERRGGIRHIAYGQVLSVSQVRSGHSHKKWIILGVVVGAVVVVIVVIVTVVKTKGPFAL